MEPTIIDYLRNAEEQRKLRQGVLDALNRGIVAGGLGGVADMGNTVLNLGKAAYGYVGNKTGLLSADQMPELVDKPVLGSEWWGDRMQRAGMVSAERNEPAELAAGLLALGAQTKAPQVVRGLLAAERNLAAPATMSRGPIGAQRGAVDVDRLTAAERAARMDAMGMERGWFRAGQKITDGRRNGPWYTQDASEAAGYLKPGGDLREYAIPKAGFLEANGRYSHKLPNAVADILDDPYFGKQGAGLAKELRTYGEGEGILGGQLWQSLESRFGNDGAAEVLQRLGAFKGAKGMTRADEAYVFKGHPVRDAEKAAFNLSKYSVDDIFGGATLPMLGVLGGTALGATYLGRKE